MALSVILRFTLSYGEEMAGIEAVVIEKLSGRWYEFSGGHAALVHTEDWTYGSWSLMSYTLRGFVF